MPSLRYGAILLLIGGASLVLLLWPGPTIDTTLRPDQIEHAGGNAYFVNLVPLTPRGLDLRGGSNADPHQSALVLFRNDAPIGPPYASHDMIVAVGGGAYSHWQSGLYFSTPDNSDPRVDRQRYSIRVKSTFGPELRWTLSLVASIATGLLLVFVCQLWRRNDMARSWLLAAAALGLVLAEGALVLLLVWPDRTIVVPLSSTNIEAERGYAYRVHITKIEPAGFEVQGDSEAGPQRSQLVVLRNGVPLGPAHANHDLIALTGNGAYSHWGNRLYFSTPGNVDPRADGQQYSISVKASLRPGVWFGAAVSAIAMVPALLLLLARLRRRRFCLLPGDRFGNLLKVTPWVWVQRFSLACCSLYLTFVASGLGSFVVETFPGALAYTAARGSLYLILFSFPLALICGCADLTARRFLIAAIAGSTCIIGLAVLTDPSPPFSSTVEKTFLLSLFQMVGFGTLFVTLRHDRRLQAVAVGVLVVAASLCLFELVWPGALSSTKGRSAGLYQNPNLAAVALGLLCFAITAAERSRSALVIPVTGIALLTTLSRSGIIAFIVALATMLTRVAAGLAVPRLAAIAVGALLLLVVVGALAFHVADGHLPTSALGGALNDSLRAVEIILAPNGDSASGVDRLTAVSSSVERWRLMLVSLEAIGARPFTGYGLEAAWQFAPHNIFLLFALAFGLLGLLVVPLLLLSCIATPQDGRMAGVAFFLTACLFSHDILFSAPLIACSVFLLTSGTRVADFNADPAR